jgi:hypothetical protein
MDLFVTGRYPLQLMECRGTQSTAVGSRKRGSFFCPEPRNACFAGMLSISSRPSSQYRIGASRRVASGHRRIRFSRQFPQGLFQLLLMGFQQWTAAQI